MLLTAVAVITGISTAVSIATAATVTAITAYQVRVAIFDTYTVCMATTEVTPNKLPITPHLRTA